MAVTNLCFLIALKSQRTSNNWEQVCSVFERSLVSVYRQTNPHIKILIVCHEKPTLSGRYDDRVEFIPTNLPLPDGKKRPFMSDKWDKIAVGMKRVQEIDPQFLMLMDADDLVSNRLAEFVSLEPNANGWIIKQGYEYVWGRRWLLRSDHFNCGTNAIINCRHLDFPADFSEKERNRCVVLRVGHLGIEAEMEKIGTPLSPLPFRGAVYVLGHGDNDSVDAQKISSRNIRHAVYRLSRLRFKSSSFRKEFGFDD